MFDVMAITELNTRLNAFIWLLRDTNRGPEWIANASTIQLLARPEPNQDLVHSRFDAPWPIRSRDMVTLSTFSQDAESLILTLDVKDAAESLPINEHWVRMKHVWAIWQLSPLASGLVEICYRGSADPAGHIPLWLANQLLLKGTFTTFVKLRQLLVENQYQHKTLSGIQEPSVHLETKISNNP
ncbi:START domain-containing protein [Bowmanella denitrificans]